MNNIIESFKTAMLDAGITPPDVIITDDRLHRFKIDGKLNGAYVLHTDGRAAGYFEDYKQGIKQNWKLDGTFAPLTDAEKKAFAIERKKQALAREAEEKARHETAVKKAASIWAKAIPALTHSYLTKKQVQAHTTRVHDGALVVPLYDASGLLVSLQFINADGGKRMMKGGKAQGSCCFIGASHAVLNPRDKILICEGWATGASLFEATGYFTIAAFSAGNLSAVAIQICKQHPDNEIIICGDNDVSGVGQQAAIKAALACNGRYVIPPETGDFNDYRTGLQGAEHVE